MAAPAFSICVYCGSRNGDDPRFAEMAKQVGTWIGAHGGQLVYGGGRNGLMGIVAQATLAAGGQVIGIIPTGQTAKPYLAKAISEYHADLIGTPIALARVATIVPVVNPEVIKRQDLQRRQALAIAESLLEEVMLMPLTFCDGDDANVESASSAAGCAGAADATGAEAGEGEALPARQHLHGVGGGFDQRQQPAHHQAGAQAAQAGDAHGDGGNF